MSVIISIITIMNTAYNVIKIYDMRRIATGDYSLDNFSCFEKDLLWEL